MIKLKIVLSGNEEVEVNFRFDKTPRNGNDMIKSFEKEAINAVFSAQRLKTAESIVLWTGGHAIRKGKGQPK